MDTEEIAGKYSMKDLRPIAKKYGVKTHCVKKIDVVKALSGGAGGAGSSNRMIARLLQHIGFM